MVQILIPDIAKEMIYLVKKRDDIHSQRALHLEKVKRYKIVFTISKCIISSCTTNPYFGYHFIDYVICMY